MNIGLVKRGLAFIAVSYSIALALDALLLHGLLPAAAWGFTRMWSVALSAALCLAYFEGRASRVLSYLRPSVRALKLYLLSPLAAYAALGIYVAIALPLGLFDFSAYVELIAKELARAGVSAQEAGALAPTVAYSQLAMAYVAAVTVNALFALGEELGWRGYLYDLLSRGPTLRATLAIGLAWGLWHAPATVLLGVNYWFNRLAGVLLFTALTTSFTYPQLLVTDRAEGSVLPPSALHGAINATWGLTAVATRVPMEVGEVVLGLGLTGIAAWTVLSLALYLLTRRRARGLGPLTRTSRPLPAVS